MISVQELFDDVYQIAFPAGRARNALSAHRNYAENALIHLQTYIPCLQENHASCYQEADINRVCNIAEITHQRGRIKAVYAFKPGHACDRYMYAEKPMQNIQCFMKSEVCCSNIDDGDPENDNQSQETFCATQEADAAATAERNWKCQFKIFAKGPNQKLMLAPAPPCDYVVVVLWDGIKRKWNDADLITDDADLRDAVSLYVEWQKLLRLECDPALAKGRWDNFLKIHADMWHRCRHERRIIEASDCYGPIAEWWDALETECTTTTVATGSTTTSSTSSTTTTPTTTTTTTTPTTTSTTTTTTTTTSSTTTTTTTTTSTTTIGTEGTTTVGTAGGLAVCLNEFECISTSAVAGEGDVDGEWDEFDKVPPGSRTTYFTTGRETCDYKFRFVIDFGSGCRWDSATIRIANFAGQPYNERWSTEDVASYPLVIYPSVAGAPDFNNPINIDYVESPFSALNSLGQFTGIQEFFAYGQIFIPADARQKDHFKIELQFNSGATTANIDAFIQNTLNVDNTCDSDALYISAECEMSLSYSLEVVFVPSGDPAPIEADFGNCAFVLDTGTDTCVPIDGTALGAMIGEIPLNPPCTPANGCGPATPQTLEECQEYDLYWRIAQGGPPGAITLFGTKIEARRGMRLNFDPNPGAWSFASNGRQCFPCGFTTPPPPSVADLQGPPVCYDTAGPTVNDLTFACEGCGWVLDAITVIGGTLIGSSPDIGAAFLENQTVTVVVEMQNGSGETFFEEVDAVLGACSTGSCDTAILSDVSQSNQVCFGAGAAYPAGTYRVEYLEGAYQYWGATGNFTAHGITVLYNGGVAETGWIVPAPVFPNYSSEAAVQAAHAGDSVQFVHTGGTICINFNDSNYADNTIGTPAPTFRLVAVV